LREAIREFRPDIIYVDSALYGAQFKLMSFIARKRKPLIVHLRGDWWREYWAWFSMTRRRKLVDRLAETQQYVYNWTSLLLANKVTPICKWLERVVRHYIPGKRTEVVYQGVDPHQFYPEEGFEFQRPAVAIIQNHTIHPKVLGLVNFKKVTERLPEVHFYITEGENIYQPFLQDIKERYSTSRNVHFVSGVDSPSGVRKMLTASDCYVLASELDCCPTTVLEASLMRRPVIASRVGGVPEIVQENQTGWTISNGATDDWVQKINLVVTDAKLNRRLGEKGREWVSKRFGWATVARQVESLILNEACE